MQTVKSSSRPVHENRGNAAKAKIRNKSEPPACGWLKLYQLYKLCTEAEKRFIVISLDILGLQARDKAAMLVVKTIQFLFV